MKKHILTTTIMAAFVALTLLVMPQRADAADCFNKESAVSFFVDNAPVTPVESVDLNGELFAAVKGFAVVLGADNIRCEQGGVTVFYGGHEISFKDNSRLGIVDGYYYFRAKTACKFENNTLMAPIDLLYRCFGASATVSADGTTNLTTGLPLDADLTADDVDLLTHLVQAEAGNQSLEGKIGVAAVVLNRMESWYFPKKISDIIYDASSGVQFDTAYNGALYNTPDADSVTAVYKALDGVNPVSDALFFSALSDCWASRNRPLVAVIGDHYFFA